MLKNITTSLKIIESLQLILKRNVRTENILKKVSKLYDILDPVIKSSTLGTGDMIIKLVCMILQVETFE